MPVDERNIASLLNRAWSKALSSKRPLEDFEVGEGDDHHQLSQYWVFALAEEFKAVYDDVDDRYRTFWAGNSDYREEYGLNELLYDVMICRTELIQSLQSHPQPLETFEFVDWQIESELERNTRSIKNDMIKLIAGSATNKLMVISHRANDTIRTLLDENHLGLLASRCEGSVFLCLVSHPQEWRDSPRPPQAYKWNRDQNQFICVS